MRSDKVIQSVWTYHDNLEDEWGGMGYNTFKEAVKAGSKKYKNFFVGQVIQTNCDFKIINVHLVTN